MTSDNDLAPSSTRKRSRRQMLGALALAAAGMAVDAGWWEPRHPIVERRSIQFADLPAGLDGLRLAQVSDLHRSLVVSEREIKHAVAMTNALTPDLILLTGDYVTTSTLYAEPCAA